MTKIILSLITAALVCLGASTSVTAQKELPNPVLAFVGQEAITSNGKTVVRYNYKVDNSDAYPAAMFAASPALPPCGKNTKASRTWIDLYDIKGTRLYGFCALTKPSDLNTIWFALDPDTVPPSWVYVELTDRATNTKYKSNLAETVL